MRIEQAFRNIPKGKIGIREAAAIDARLYEGGLYEDIKQYAQIRATDIEDRWQDIPDEVLAADNAVFSYLDDAGFRFIMPAIMRWSLKPGIEDRNYVTEFFVMKLLPYSQKADQPDNNGAKMETLQRANRCDGGMAGRLFIETDTLP